MSVSLADPDAVNPFGEPTTQALLDDIEKRYDFWNATPQLQLIAATAVAEDISAWGLLALCLAHRVSHIPPTVVLPKKLGGAGATLAEGTSLNAFVSLDGPSGGNKSVTFRAASGLLKPNGMPLPDGTGQGLVKKIAKTAEVTKDEDGKPLKEPYSVVHFYRHSLVIHAPEVKTLNAEFARDASKTAALMCSMWVGETLGMTNADKDRDAVVPPNMARIVGIWGVQPHNAAALMELASDGIPQRWLWAPAEETRDVAARRVPPPPNTTFPFPVFGTTPPGIAMGSVLPKEVRIDTDGSVADESDLPDPIWIAWSPQMRTDVLAFFAARKASRPANLYADISPEQAAEAERLTYESHFVLLRIKVACWLGFLWGHANPDDMDWHLSGAVMEVVRAEAAGVWKRSAEEAQKEAAKRGYLRGLEQDVTETTRGALKSERIVSTAELLYTKLASKGPQREAELRRGLRSERRPLTRDALHHLEDNGKAEYDGVLWYAVYKGNKLTRDSGTTVATDNTDALAGS